jgi:hypothetical protein
MNGQRTEVNQNKSTHVSFTLRNQACPALQTGNVPVYHKKKKHIKTKRNELDL